MLSNFIFDSVLLRLSVSTNWLGISEFFTKFMSGGVCAMMLNVTQKAKERQQIRVLFVVRWKLMIASAAERFDTFTSVIFNY